MLAQYRSAAPTDITATANCRSCCAKRCKAMPAVWCSCDTIACRAVVQGQSKLLLLLVLLLGCAITAANLCVFIKELEE